MEHDDYGELEYHRYKEQLLQVLGIELDETKNCYYILLDELF
jgi:hypothetical protein